MTLNILKFVNTFKPKRLRNLFDRNCLFQKSIFNTIQDYSSGQPDQPNEVQRAHIANNNRPMVTIFDQIMKREIPADIVYEDERCLAFTDVRPQAPIHLLLIPKKRIPMIADASDSDQELLGHLLLTARKLANEKLKNGYRLVINNGPDGCQTIYHLHIHILGGRQLGWPPG